MRHRRISSVSGRTGLLLLLALCLQLVLAAGGTLAAGAALAPPSAMRMQTEERADPMPQGAHAMHGAAGTATAGHDPGGMAMGDCGVSCALHGCCAPLVPFDPGQPQGLVRRLSFQQLARPLHPQGAPAGPERPPKA